MKLFAIPALLLAALVSTPAQAKLKVFACEPEWGSLVQELAGDKVLFKKVAHFENEADADVRVAVAVAWTSGYGRDNVQGFCNIVRQPEGGTHVQGLRMALPMAVRKYIDDNGLIPAKDKDLKVEGPDCFEGVYALVSIKHKSPVFKGQAKSKH